MGWKDPESHRQCPTIPTWQMLFQQPVAPFPHTTSTVPTNTHAAFHFTAPLSEKGRATISIDRSPSVRILVVVWWEAAQAQGRNRAARDTR